jgi:hypothetical protein
VPVRLPQVLASSLLPAKPVCLGLLLVVFLLLGFHLLAQSNPLPAESEISFVGGGSLGHVNLFGYADQRQLDLFGVQYARHSWGSLLTARVDYMAEVLPAVLLNEPREYGANSVALSNQRKWIYGANVSPVGVRLLWRRNKRWRPYLIGDGGVLYFKDRVLSTRGTHLNFSAEFGAGAQFRLYPRTQLRLGYSLYHFSNGDIARSNPGLDSNFVYVVFSFDLHK